MPEANLGMRRGGVSFWPWATAGIGQMGTILNAADGDGDGSNVRTGNRRGEKYRKEKVTLVKQHTSNCLTI